MPPKRKGKLSRRKVEGKRSAPSAKTVTGGYTLNRSLKTYGGTEDAEETLLNWDFYATFTGFTATTTAAYAVKGGSIYQPGGVASIGLGQTTNPVGYARLYTQYRRALVVSSQLELTTSAINGTISSGHFTTSPIALPVDVAVVFADTTTATSYVASYTATDIAGIPHAVCSFSLPGKGPATLRCRGNTGVAVMGTKNFDPKIMSAAVGSTSAATGADPSNNFFYVIAFTNNGNLTIDALQFRVRVKYRVRFFDPVATNVQVSTEPSINRGGGQIAIREKLETKTTHAAEHKGDPRQGADLSAAEAFEEWGDVDSEYAVFLEARAAQKRAARRILVATDQDLVDQIKGTKPLSTGSSAESVTCPTRQVGAGTKSSAKGTT